MSRFFLLFFFLLSPPLGELSLDSLFYKVLGHLRWCKGMVMCWPWSHGTVQVVCP